MEQDLSNNPRATQRYCDKFKVKHDSFKFKPAHRDIILSIPGICEDMKEEMDKMSNPDKSIKTKKKKTASPKQPTGSKQKSTASTQSLKEVLVSKVRRCAQAIGLKLEDQSITEHNIIGFERSSSGDNLYSCQFTCPLCRKAYVANYKKTWDTSNIKKHFSQKHRLDGPTGLKKTEIPNDKDFKSFFSSPFAYHFAKK